MGASWDNDWPDYGFANRSGYRPINYLVGEATS